MSSEAETSSGVQQLIDRLHKEGVAKGRGEAEALVAAARQEATEILDQAKREADAIVAAAQQEAEHVREGGEEAIRLAGRDAILSLTEELRDDFVRKLKGLVGHTLKDTEFLKQLILEIARRAVPEQTEGPANVVLLKEATATGAQPHDDALDELVRSLGGEALRDGLTYEVAGNDTPGVRIQVVDDNLEIDLTSETLTHLLLKYLSPRFRTILDQS